nr:transposase, MuDR, MULE transposase domain protein [Tanacetum cinerariifolium]
IHQFTRQSLIFQSSIVNNQKFKRARFFDNKESLILAVRLKAVSEGICGCRKWQLSGISCGHVIAITRFLGLTDCVHYAADWFKKPKYQATYSESIHSLGNMHQWEFPENIQKAIPPRMDNPQPGRPKNTNRIKSQGEEPRIIRCTRCTQTGHRRDQCSQPFVVQPPVNIRTHNDQQFTQNNQPSFNNPTQQYDNTFHNVNHYTSQQYGDTTYPSQPYYENEARQAIVLKLQREIQAEETLAHQLLCNLTRYTEEMHIRSLQITRLQTMPTTSRNTYGLHALLMTLEADIRTTNIIL